VKPARTGLANRRLRSYGLAIAVVLLDQLSKAWALKALAAGPRPFIPGLLDFSLTFNTGAAFSLFTGGATGLGVVSLAVVGAAVLWLQRQNSLPLVRLLGAGFLLGGAAGNGIDRWRTGAVVDFLALVPIDFPVFNLADVAINLAVLCIAIDVLRAQPAEGS
jgi:signal peptidase II